MSESERVVRGLQKKIELIVAARGRTEIVASGKQRYDTHSGKAFE